MSTRHITACAAALLLCAASASAQGAGGAQQPPATPATQTPDQGGAGGTGTSTFPTWELSGGYQFLRAGEDANFPFGLNVDGAWNATPMLGLVAEVGWAFDQDTGDFVDADLDAQAWHFGAGPRWTGRNEGRLWPFAQLIAGGLYSRVSGDFFGIDDTVSDTHFMLQPGVGVNYIAGDGWGIVGQVDYRRVFIGDDDEDDLDLDRGENQFRIFVGARMILD